MRGVFQLCAGVGIMRLKGPAGVSAHLNGQSGAARIREGIYKGLSIRYNEYKRSRSTAAALQASAVLRLMPETGSAAPSGAVEKSPGRAFA